jgi:L-amino acid N-acyltransferase YncA
MRWTPNVRLSRPDDINIIRALDAKCYDYPLEMKEWEKLINQSGKNNKARCVVVEAARKPLGFAVWSTFLSTGGHSRNVQFLYKLGVKKDKRRNGLGTLMLDTCISEAVKAQAEVVRTIVPEIHCDPGDPDDVSIFLKKSEFVATGEIVENYVQMFGQLVDGFVFEKDIRWA